MTEEEFPKIYLVCERTCFRDKAREDEVKDYYRKHPEMVGVFGMGVDIDKVTIDCHYQPKYAFSTKEEAEELIAHNNSMSDPWGWYVLVEVPIGYYPYHKKFRLPHIKDE